MRDLLRRIAPVIRDLGFKGSGKDYRMVTESFVYVINFQGTRAGETFFVNFGAHPKVIPMVESVRLNSLKEYDCAFRERVEGEWNWEMNEKKYRLFEGQIKKEQASYFGKLALLPTAISEDEPLDMIERYRSNFTKGRTAFHLSVASKNLGYPNMALRYAELGLELTNERATTLRRQLKAIIESDCRAS